MKNKIILIVLFSLLIPNLTLAVWWNPFSWFEDEVKTEIPIETPSSTPPVIIETETKSSWWNLFSWSKQENSTKEENSVKQEQATTTKGINHFSKEEYKEKEAEQIKLLLVEINKAINLMDAVKDEMPREMLETHEYLMSGVLGGKLYRADPKLKDLIMYHGAKTQAVYINPTIELKSELWIPIFYHEVAHNYWHTKHPAKTFEEFEAQLFNSENYAYIVNSQAWDLVMRHYPIEKDDLKTKLEQGLFKNYSNETEIYNEMIKGNSKAEEFWNRIVETDITEQKKQQKLLFEK